MKLIDIYPEVSTHFICDTDGLIINCELSQSNSVVILVTFAEIIKSGVISG